MENQMKNDPKLPQDETDASSVADALAIIGSPIAPSLAQRVDEKIEIWFAKHFHNLGALLDERVHNILHAAKEDLKAELTKLANSL
jgi:hypothetical protein